MTPDPVFPEKAELAARIIYLPLLFILVLIMSWKKVATFRRKQKIKRLSTIFPKQCTVLMIIQIHEELENLGSVPGYFYENAPKALASHFCTSTDPAPKTLSYICNGLETHLSTHYWLDSVIMNFAQKASLKSNFKSRVIHYPKTQVNADLKVLNDLVERVGLSFEETRQQNAAKAAEKLPYNPQPRRFPINWK